MALVTSAKKEKTFLGDEKIMKTLLEQHTMMNHAQYAQGHKLIK